MYSSSALDSFVEIITQIARRQSFAHTYAQSLLVNRGLSTHPHDVVDSKLVAEYDFTVFIYIYDCIKTGIWEAEIVQERRVLAIRIGVILIVCATIIIA